MNPLFKAIIVAIIAGGSLIASVYLAYVLILIGVLGGVGFMAYLYFKSDNVDTDFFD